MERRYPTIHEENFAYLQLKKMEDLSSHLRNFQITTTKEDLLTSMVKEKILIQIDELEDFLKKFDPNYYSPLTSNSAFSYAVKHKNIEFALHILEKMKGEYSNKPDQYFQRDLEKLSELFESELFKNAYESDKNNKNGKDDLIVRIAKALTVEETYRQFGRRLKNSKKVNSSENSLPLGQKLGRAKERYNRKIEELGNKFALDNHCIIYPFGTSVGNKMPLHVQRALASRQTKYAEEIDKLIIDYHNEIYDLNIESILYEVSTFFRDKWKKNFNTLQEVQAMLVLHVIPPFYSVYSEIYVAANPHIPSLVKNEAKLKIENDELLSKSFKLIKAKNLIFESNYFQLRDPNRHAEEILCDKLKELKTVKRAYIYGTKRPCLSCYSRMQMENELSQAELRFSKDHGKFWMHTVTHVGDKSNGRELRNYKVAINSLQLLATSAVTEDK